MAECRKGRNRAIPFDCKAGAGHEGSCTPYTLPPQADYLKFATDLATWLPLRVRVVIDGRALYYGIAFPHLGSG
jgi:hypothetical protein